MSRNAHRILATNFQGTTRRLSIALGLLAVVIFTASQASAQTPLPDILAPLVTPPASIVVEATGPLGTPATDSSIVEFLGSATALDNVDGRLIVTNDAPEVFPFGPTLVTFRATDSAFNTDAAQAKVTVAGIAPPLVTPPVSITVEATRPSGISAIHASIAAFLRDATALDAADGPVAVTNDAPAVFPLGQTQVTFTAKDSTSNRDAAQARVNVVDTTAPLIFGDPGPPANAAGWNNANVTVVFTCHDRVSGVSNCEVGWTITIEGEGQRVRGTAIDQAGNTATIVVGDINIDKTAPIVAIASPAQDAVFLANDTVVADWTASDSLSGISSSSGTVPSGLPIDTSFQGLNSFTITASDEAGNTASASHSYTVLIPFVLFEIDAGHLLLERGAPTDEFEMQGRFEPAGTSNGIDVLNEDVTVTLGGFIETIPAGSFVRDADDNGYQFIGASKSITQASLSDDGGFRVQGKRLDLESIFDTNLVLFSLRIGDDVGQVDIRSGFEPFSIEIREARDLFGTVVFVTAPPEGQGVLVINTKDGLVHVLTDPDTRFILPQNRDGAIEDLVAGDRVAASLGERGGSLIANTVLLVPSKTQYRHVPGVVVDYIVDEQITIQPPGAGAKSVTFNVNQGTNINLRTAADELTKGLFVVVSVIRDPLTGDVSPDALEVNVTSGRPKIDVREFGEGSGELFEALTAFEFQGIFEGVYADGNLIVNGAKVFLAPNTEIEGALVVGQVVNLKGILREDGTILAQEVNSRGGDEVISNRIELKGVFQGIDPESGNWIISQRLVAVGPGTDTDGLPSIGQRVKINALLQDDGILLAREIENQNGV